MKNEHPEGVSCNKNYYQIFCLEISLENFDGGYLCLKKLYDQKKRVLLFKNRP